MLRKWDLIVDASGHMRTTRDVLYYLVEDAQVVMLVIG
jgi:hypothetical protein